MGLCQALMPCLEKKEMEQFSAGQRAIHLVARRWAYDVHPCTWKTWPVNLASLGPFFNIRCKELGLLALWEAESLSCI